MGFEDISSPQSGEIVMVPDFNNYVIKLIIAGDGVGADAPPRQLLVEL